MRNDSRRVGFAINSVTSMGMRYIYHNPLPSFTFYLELFDTNRTRTLHSNLRVKNVFIKEVVGQDGFLFEADCAGRQSLKP